MPDNENQKRLKAQIHEAAEMLIRIMDQPSPPPAIGIDLDGTIDGRDNMSLFTEQNE